MKLARQAVALGFLAMASGALGTVIPAAHPPTPNCQNKPESRNCWGLYDINTDYYKKWPTTGKTVSYTLEVTELILSPDGHPKPTMAINGMSPGPRLVADWGDILEVTVINSLTTNGTGIHWHGVRQLNSNIMDGVPGTTECPIAPGSSKTYKFQLTQYGTTWYHSHFTGQYADGVYGTLQINGPATANYDIDLGIFPITDYFYNSFAFEAVHDLLIFPNRGDTGLINGSMLSPDGLLGGYSHTILTPGKKHLLRVVNTALQNQFMISLDKHKMTVISTDFVPIVPYETEWLFVAIGQRYDIIIEADQDPTIGYWFQIVPPPCPLDSSNINAGNIKSIFSYEGLDPNSQTFHFPATTAWPYTPTCVDDLTFTPWVARDVPSKSFASAEKPLDLTAAFTNSIQGTNVFQWMVNGVIFETDWRKPILEYVGKGDKNFTRSSNIITLPDDADWTYWVITTNQPVNHPIHLHGHDFYVLGAGPGSFPGPSALKFKNPTRRDSTMIEQFGWLVIAFEVDNPGAWLLHCHIAFHASEGLAVQFLEQASKIPKNQTLAALAPECAKWNSFAATMPFPQEDSGI